MQQLLFALSLGFGIFILQSQAHSAPSLASCADRTKVITSLDQKYGETQRTVGLGQNNSLIEMYASDTTGTWTILLTLPDGRSCLMAAGNAFQQTAPVVTPAGEPT